MKILVLGTACWTFEKFRGSILKNFISNGHEVLAIGTNNNFKSEKFLNSIGVTYYCINFDKNKTDIKSFLFSIYRAYTLTKTFKPDVCLAYFLKPILMASILKYFLRFPLVSLVEGLGHVFVSESKFIKSTSRFFLSKLLLYSDRLVFLNTNDINELYSRNINILNKISIIRGIGLDLKYYNYHNIERGCVNFLFLSRLLESKGLIEFVEAAKYIKERFHNCAFHVYGQHDPSSKNLVDNCILPAHRNGFIRYGGCVHDVREVLKESHVLVLPTFYREGLPRCIQESFAVGRPVITTKYAGCSEIIIDKFNGIIVDSKNTHELSNAIEWFITNSNKLDKMSLNCRKTAEIYFNCNHSDFIIMNNLKYVLK